MAEAQAAKPSAPSTGVNKPTRSLAQQVAADQIAKAGPNAFAAAVNFLERVFLRASKNKYGERLTLWIDPEVTDREYVAVRDSVISDVLQQGPVYKEGLAAKREYYNQQVLLFASILEEVARTWTLENLDAETQRVFRLLTTIRPRVKELHRAALSVRATVDATREVTIQGRTYSVPTFVLPTMTGDEVREATGESRTGGTVRTRVRRMSYMHVLLGGPVIAAGAQRIPAQTDAYQNLLTLMAHPRGVEIIDEFAKSSEAGWDLTSELMSDTFTAIVKLRSEIVTDKTLVWRFPPAISAGVASLGLGDRSGITQFALAWGASRKSKLDQALEIAGNTLFVLDLVGGPLGATVSGILDFVLAGIGTAVSFLRDVNQDQAATSTAFAKRSERLSQGSNKIGTILQGFAAIAAGLAVPGAVAKIVGRRTTQVVRFPTATERLAPMREIPNPRGITADAVRREPFNAVERGLTGNGREITQKEIASKFGYSTPDEVKFASGPVFNSTPNPTKPLTANETRYRDVLKAAEDDLGNVLTTKKIGITAAEAETIAANLRKSLPAKVPTSVPELRKAIEDIMDAATRQAWAEGLVNSEAKNALGIRAHRYAEYLLDQLNVMLARGKTRIGVFAEQFVAPLGPGDFLLPAGPTKDFRWILSERKKDWLGIDAIVYENGVAVLAIDLKTGRAWSKSELKVLLERFGLNEDQLIQYHPNLFGN